MKQGGGQDANVEPEDLQTDNADSGQPAGEFEIVLNYLEQAGGDYLMADRLGILTGSDCLLGSSYQAILELPILTC